MRDTMHNANLGMKILVGPDDVVLQKKNAMKTILAQVENPVVNPPFNNWSVNQPSPPHQRGLDGEADLGQNILVDGHPVHFVQISDEPLQGMTGEEEIHGKAMVGGDSVVFHKAKRGYYAQNYTEEIVNKK